jgi:hypothetical protein
VYLKWHQNCGSTPIGHSTTKEVYKAIPLPLEKLNYQEHQWVNFVAKKMVKFLLGQENGYSKNLCYYAFGRVEPNMSPRKEKMDFEVKYVGWKTK